MKAYTKVAVSIFIVTSLLASVNSRGKTYDDLDDIIKHQADGRLASRDNHKAYQVPVG